MPGCKPSCFHIQLVVVMSRLKLQCESSLPCVLWPYCIHDGIPCGGEDVSVVVALIVSL